jgi:hypothetical protein
MAISPLREDVTQMGARVNFVFKDNTTDTAVGLYSHWGADSWQVDLADAIRHAKVRQGDFSYFTRMVISHLIKDEVMEETGFGIFAVNPSDIGGLWDEVVLIDLNKNTVNDEAFSSFLEQYERVSA